METIRTEHLSEAELEDCARGRLLRDDAPAVLSHLTNCDHCAALLEQEQDLRRDLRNAVELAAAAEQQTPKPTWARIRAFPAPALAAVAAIGAVLLLGPSFQATKAHTQTVELTAYRGEAAARASAGSPLVLNMDATGLEAAAQLELRIVDGTGRQVWRSVPQLAGSQWTQTVHSRLRKGVYWVRLSPEGQASPLREYRLAVE